MTAAAGDPDPGDDLGEGMTLLMEDTADWILERYTAMRVRGVTACAVSAFTSAFIELDPGEIELVEDAQTAAASGGWIATTTQPLTWTSSGAATTDIRYGRRPPADAFHLPEPQPGDEDDGSVYGVPVQDLLVEQPDGNMGVPFTVVDREGWVACFGHAALWGTCHVGYPGQCVTAPESKTDYSGFHVGSCVCDDGTKVSTGVLTMSTDHAAAHLLAPEARDHYANTGLGFADVRATNGALGIWTAGVLRPSITPEQRQAIEGSALSGDWRRDFDVNNLEFISALAVNTPGFQVRRELAASALTASAYSVDGEQMSLTAAGVVFRCADCQKRALAEANREDEVLRLLRQVELRTRHLTTPAAEWALARLARR
jgi:hypothetical protein